MFTKETFMVLALFAIMGLLLLGVSTLIGWIVKLSFHLARNYGLYIGCGLLCLCVFVAIWGIGIGFSRFETSRLTLYFDDLPKEFDGYKIIHFTDAHVGSFVGRENLWSEAVDAMLREDADLIVFTGDLQNRSPEEIAPFVKDMSRLKARDGVFSVLGNHDYGYPPTPSSPKEVRRMEEEAGWQMLVNECVAIERGESRIILGGMDNDGDGKHFPRRGNLAKTLSSPVLTSSGASSDSIGLAPAISPDDFVVMLEHDPTSWRRNILPNSGAQLTLSGHTHAMQFGIFGWSPSKWIYPEWRGLFSDGDRKLYVSSGIGGVIPFRFGMPREFVVIELRCHQSKE